MNYWNKNSKTPSSLRGKLTFLLLFCVTFLTSLPVLADGSKNLYPNGVKGARAYLRTSTQSTENWPFANNGIHYVYAKKDEKITLANSSPSINGNRAVFIIEYLDQNKQVITKELTNSLYNVTSDKSIGYIRNRAQELAGPKTNYNQNKDAYTPHVFDVPSEGVYKISMKYISSPGDAFIVHPNNFNPDKDWAEESINKQPNVSNFIAAWDISVVNVTNTAFVPGRVYANLLNLGINGAEQIPQAFYGNLKILTKDRHVYNINNNGNNGYLFTFFANNNGFTTSENNIPKASYLSLNSSLKDQIEKNVYNPNLVDTEYNITHKIFYTLPQNIDMWDLPETSIGAVPGGETWLKQPLANTDLSNVKITGFEGTLNQMGSKGATISFDANITGSYTITISDPLNANFEPIILSGYTKKGTNQYFWDGKDSQGNIVPASDTPLQVGIELLGGEVHFPFFDVELNINGTIISRLNDDFSIASDIVYWDDSTVMITTTGFPNNNGSTPDPKVNSHLKGSKGLSSAENGHRYGIGNSEINRGYGNGRSLDTWSFIKAPMVIIEGGLLVKKSDLQIKQVKIPQDLTIDQAFTIEVSVFNEGPTSAQGAVFAFEVPEGFTPGEAKISSQGNCALETSAIALNTQKDKFSSVINMESGCTLTYSITLTPTKTTTSNLAISILRPADNWDVDATNPTSDRPTDPTTECGNGGKLNQCNNNTIIELKVEEILYSPVISNRNIYHKVN
ncbi:flagellar hook assembly protein FlgD [Myroides sp. LJL115]